MSRPFHRPFLPQESLSASTKGHHNTDLTALNIHPRRTCLQLLQPFIHIISSRSKHTRTLASKLQINRPTANQPKSEHHFLAVETTRKTRGHTPHKGGMEGAAGGARAAAEGLSCLLLCLSTKVNCSPFVGLRELSLFGFFTPLPLSHFRSICWPPPVTFTRQNNGSSFGNSRVVDVLHVKKLSNTTSNRASLGVPAINMG